MTQEEILQYNKRCAEFLGWIIDDIPESLGGGKGWFYDNVYQCELGLEMFDEDWNCIIEVVEAIEKLGGAVCIGNSNAVMIVFYLTDVMGESYSKTREFSGETKKEAAVEAINQFLIWYNQNK